MSAREAIHNRMHGEGYCEPPCSLCREVADLIDDLADEECEKRANEARAFFGVDGADPPAHCAGTGCHYCAGVSAALALINGMQVAHRPKEAPEEEGW